MKMACNSLTHILTRVQQATNSPQGALLAVKYLLMPRKSSASHQWQCPCFFPQTQLPVTIQFLLWLMIQSLMMIVYSLLPTNYAQLRTCLPWSIGKFLVLEPQILISTIMVIQLNSTCVDRQSVKLNKGYGDYRISCCASFEILLLRWMQAGIRSVRKWEKNKK